MRDFDNGLAEPLEDNLILSSLINFKPLIKDVMKAANVRSVCEIGVDQGVFSQWLIQFVRKNKLRYMAVDPVIPENTKSLLKSHEYTEEKSLPFFKKTKALYDLYILDGDHNYYTVRSELEWIAKKARGNFPLCVLHDLNWPWGRRDLYYNIDDIPKKHRQPATNEGGITIGNKEIADIGFCQGGDVYFAKKEGGERNGVLTAIEDFMQAYERKYGRPLTLVKVPIFFGLGILYDPQLLSEKQKKQFEKFAFSNMRAEGFLKKVEYNRASLALKVIELTALLQKERE
ncbi:MAG: class I SAM-dependent methyltransferase [Alphaproteobacteria bacterium]